MFVKVKTFSEKVIRIDSDQIVGLCSKQNGFGDMYLLGGFTIVLDRVSTKNLEAILDKRYLVNDLTKEL